MDNGQQPNGYEPQRVEFTTRHARSQAGKTAVDTDRRTI